MQVSSAATWLARAIVLLAMVVSGQASAATLKRVLILHSFGRDFAPFQAVAPAFRTRLAELQSEPVAFHEASIDVERVGLQGDDGPFVDFLLSRYPAAPPDLVVTISAPASHFYLRSRSRLFPDAALLATGLDRRVAQSLTLAAQDRTVSGAVQFDDVAKGITELLPDLRLLVLVYGASPQEQVRRDAALRDMSSLDARLRIEVLSGLALEQVRQRVASLPADSAVFYGMYLMGPDGVPQESDRALASLHHVANAPMFGLYAEQLGRGTVGGALFDMRELGVRSAELAYRMLSDAGSSSTTSVVVEPRRAFDWRELQRWGIPESRLPLGADVRFRPPSVWEQYQRLIIWSVTIVLLQAALIGALLFQRTRRRSAEKEAIGLSGRLLTAHEDERRRLARELHDDLTQRLARLAIDAGRMERATAAPEGVRALREDLVRLSEDVHALSYRLHPSVLDDLGLVEALRAECDRVARHGALRVDLDARDVPDGLPDDASLCLFRVAQEAMSNATRHGGASAVTVLLMPSGSGLQLAVSDNGSGFDALRARTRASLGLGSMRERVRLLRGQLDIESSPGRGTTVVAWVPA